MTDPLPVRREPRKEKTVLIPLTLAEFQLVIDALDGYSAAAQLAISIAYPHLTSKGRRGLDVARVDPKMLRGQLFARLQKAEKQ